MRMKVWALSVIPGVLLFAGQALAHHAFSAEYDASKTIELKGVVTKVEWTNPHVRFYVDVKDAKGIVTNWDLELQSVNTLSRNGWSRHALKVGDQVTVSGYLAKDGSNRANARGSVVLADGTKLFAGDTSSDDQRRR
jgi:hypothetical protein